MSFGIGRRQKLGRQNPSKDFQKIAPYISASGAAIDHGTLAGLADDDHSQYVHISSARTITAQHSFAPTSTQAPFTLGANAQGQLVTGLNADQLDSLDSSSNPGAAAAILKTDASGYLQIERIGLGVAPSYPLHVRLGSSPQVQLEYDASNYVSLGVDGSGNLSIAPTGDLILDPTGNDVLPNTGYDINLGSISKKYLTLHAAELWVQTLVAQGVLATVGGRVLVGPTTKLTSDLGPSDTTIYVEHNSLANGDRVYLESSGNVEFIAITSAPSGTGPYSYTVTRDLDGSGANQWYAGDAVFNTGTTGDGFIDLYSTSGIAAGSTAGPTIVGNVRNSATYNDWTEHWAIGNLNGLYGYSSDVYGAGLGDYSNEHITIESTNGIRFRDNTTTLLNIDQTDGIWIAQPVGSAAVVSGSYSFKSGATNVCGLGSYRITTPGFYTNGMELWVNSVSGYTSRLDIGVDGPSGYGALVNFYIDYNSGSTFTQLVLEEYGSGGILRLWSGSDSSRIFINETVNDKQTAGITINQTGSDDEILSLKSSDVNHGMSTLTEIDTFGAFFKSEPAYGGTTIVGYSSNILGFESIGVGTNDVTTKSASSEGYVVAKAWKKSGTSLQIPGSNSNIFVIESGNSTRLIVDQEGEVHSDAGTAGSSFDGAYHTKVWDEYDDIMLLTGLRASIVPSMRERFADFVQEARPVLEKTGVVTYNDGPDGDGSIFVAHRGLQMLTIDAVRQLHQKIVRLEKRIDELTDN